MNIVHVEPNSKRKINSLPITGNYLIPEKDGTFRWAEPNDAWRLYSYTGGKRCLIANVRYDDSEHSSDLWVYSIVKNADMEPAEDKVGSRTLTKVKSDAEARMLESSRIRLDPTRKWYIRQFEPNTERIGIQRFTGLPLRAWREMWRKTIPVADIGIYGLANNQMKVRYAGMDFNAYLRWPELQADIKQSKALMQEGKTEWRLSTIVMPWLEKNCKGGLIPFSDYDVMFPDDIDEVTYTVDVAQIS